MTTPNDGKIKKMLDETKSFYLVKDLIPYEFLKLRLNLKPSRMDYKWFVYCLENDIHFHRS